MSRVERVSMTQSIRFADFQFVPQLQNALDSAGFTEPTEIQKSTIPHILQGSDIAGLAQTGTGKTAAFLLPLMERIINGSRDLSTETDEERREFLTKRSFVDWKARNFILILVPTRELAEQILSEVDKLSGGELSSVAIYGGTSYEKQKKALSEGVDFVVATPGRLIDLYKERFVDLKQVRAIVFDEADRMFDMGFKEDMVYLLQRIPKDRQFLVYSATLNFDVLNVAYRFEAEPIECNVSKDQTKAEHVEDMIFHVGDEEKPTYLLSILKKYNPRQTIVFSNFKSKVERIARFLNQNGQSAEGISSMLTQVQRNRVLEKFKDSEDSCNILVATDVAARGLDIKGVDMVVNFELPMDAENYVHRIGRTGRAGAEGKAFGFSGHDDVESLGRIEEYLGHKVEIAWLEDGEIEKDHGDFPRGERRNIRVNEGKKNVRPRRKPDDRRRRSESGGRRSEGEDHSAKRPRRKGPHHESRSDEKQQDRESQSRSSSSRKKMNNKKFTSKKSSSVGQQTSGRNNMPSWKSKSNKSKGVSGFIKKVFGIG